MDKTPLGRLRKAAVLIPLFICNGRIHVWLTKRSDRVGTDKGDVSFPGGMKEPDEDEIATCLREAKEEIGLDASQVEVLGPIYPRINRTRIFMTPIVGIVDENFHPTPNEEVAVVFHLPLDRFIKQEGLILKSFPFKNTLVNILFFSDEINGEMITTWGLTALACVEVAVGILQKQTEYDFPHDSKLSPDDPFSVSRSYLESLTKRTIQSKI